MHKVSGSYPHQLVLEKELILVEGKFSLDCLESLSIDITSSDNTVTGTFMREGRLGRFDAPHAQPSQPWLCFPALLLAQRRGPHTTLGLQDSARRLCSAHHSQPFLIGTHLHRLAVPCLHATSLLGGARGRAIA